MARCFAFGAKARLLLNGTSRSRIQARHPMALLFPTNWQRRDPYYFPDILEGFQQAMAANGCRASLLNDDIGDGPSGMPSGAAVAVVLIEPAHLQLVERLRDNGHRVLGVNRYSG